MAELLAITRTAASQVAGTKAPAAAHNRVRMAVVTMAAAYAQPAQNDTAATGIVLMKGTRLGGLPLVSNGAGTASSTLSIGLRNPVTKVAIDATAIVNALAINAAQISQPATGTKLITGQDYVLDQDAEIYLTFGGAAGLANQQIAAYIPYVAP